MRGPTVSRRNRAFSSAQKVNLHVGGSTAWEYAPVLADHLFETGVPVLVLFDEPELKLGISELEEGRVFDQRIERDYRIARFAV